MIPTPNKPCTIRQTVSETLSYHSESPLELRNSVIQDWGCPETEVEEDIVAKNILYVVAVCQQISLQYHSQLWNFDRIERRATRKLGPTQFWAWVLDKPYVVQHSITANFSLYQNTMGTLVQVLYRSYPGKWLIIFDHFFVISRQIHHFPG